jgi:hypothetical protein
MLGWRIQLKNADWADECSEYIAWWPDPALPEAEVVVCADPGEFLVAQLAPEICPQPRCGPCASGVNIWVR